jgi:hypothetical protein
MSQSGSALHLLRCGVVEFGLLGADVVLGSDEWLAKRLAHRQPVASLAVESSPSVDDLSFDAVVGVWHATRPSPSVWHT